MAWWQVAPTNKVHDFLILRVRVDGEPVFRDVLAGGNLADIDGKVRESGHAAALLVELAERKRPTRFLPAYVVDHIRTFMWRSKLCGDEVRKPLRHEHTAVWAPHNFLCILCRADAKSGPNVPVMELWAADRRVTAFVCALCFL